ncbi:MAG: hypothetical protein MI924_26225 [Chloroflexales bacterium]|nr:hypothetical protein [Chloroflexales bacterium]
MSDKLGAMPGAAGQARRAAIEQVRSIGGVCMLVLGIRALGVRLPSAQGRSR